MQKREINILISGGGTGGHIFPAIAIANALKEIQQPINILFVGALGRMEMEKVPAAGFRIIGLPISGFQRKLTLKNLTLIGKLAISLIKANRILNQFKPDVVVGVGGYASGPVLKAANRRRIPTVLQEQNSYAGVTNRLLAKKASAICVAYEHMDRYFPGEKIILTGNPVRKDILNPEIDKQKAKTYFNITNENPVILVIGGSLGARTINHAISNNIGFFKGQSWNMLWQTGKFYFEESKLIVGREKANNIQVHQFISRMDYAYALADVVVSRAGAGTISELCLVKKPVILIPSPNVAEDHQTKNAMALVKKQAALMIPDKLTEKDLPETLSALVADEEKKQSLRSNIEKMALHDAAKRIAEEVLKLVKTT